MNPTVTPSSTTVDRQIEQFRDNFRLVREQVSRVIVGNDDIIDGVMTCLLARGHVLLEGIPGLGKTKLVQTLADVLHLKFSRIQFTPDLMPGDIIGTHDRARGRRRQEVLRVPARADLRQPGARRRDQPRHAQDAVGAARGDAGEQRLGRQGTRIRCEQPFFVLATRTRSRWKAPIRCPRRSSTGSSSS